MTAVEKIRATYVDLRKQPVCGCHRFSLTDRFVSAAREARSRACSSRCDFARFRSLPPHTLSHILSIFCSLFDQGGWVSERAASGKLIMEPQVLHFPAHFPLTFPQFLLNSYLTVRSLVLPLCSLLTSLFAAGPGARLPPQARYFV